MLGNTIYCLNMHDYMHRGFQDQQPDDWYRTQSRSTTSRATTTPAPSPVSRAVTAMTATVPMNWTPNLDLNNSEGAFTCIFADVLIPGRGEPLQDAAVGISLQDGAITFVGPQAELPRHLVEAPRACVRYLLPGLWDCHTHFLGLQEVTLPNTILNHPAAMGAAAARGFHDTLMAGFTSVRDVGSYAIEAGSMISAGILLGPTIYGAGGAISITGGHGDVCELPADMVYSHRGSGQTQFWPGVSPTVIADGVDECRRAVRQQIRRGAQCIKVAVTGGVISPMDDPQLRQFSDAELVALVNEATLQGRAVAAHAHGKSGILAAVRAGVHTIEHGSYVDEEVADAMVRNGVMLVSTRNVVEQGIRHLDTLDPRVARKMLALADSHARAYRTAVRRGVKIALGTDICSSKPGGATTHGNNGNELAWAVQVGGMTALQAIEAGTINSAETLGPLMPKKGLIRVGWDADLIALDENPLANIDLFREADNIRWVWKGGEMVKCPGFKKMWPSLKTS